MVCKTRKNSETLKIDFRDFSYLILSLKIQFCDWSKAGNRKSIHFQFIDRRLFVTLHGDPIETGYSAAAFSTGPVSSGTRSDPLYLTLKKDDICFLGLG